MTYRIAPVRWYELIPFQEEMIDGVKDGYQWVKECLKQPWAYEPEKLLTKDRIALAKELRKLKVEKDKTISKIKSAERNIEILNRMFNRPEAFQKGVKEFREILEKAEEKQTFTLKVPKEFISSQERREGICQAFSGYLWKWGSYIKSWMWPFYWYRTWRSTAFRLNETNSQAADAWINEHELLDKNNLKLAILEKTLSNPEKVKLAEVQKVLRSLNKQKDQKPALSEQSIENRLKNYIHKGKYLNGKGGARNPQWYKDAQYKAEVMKQAVSRLKEELKDEKMDSSEINEKVAVAKERCQVL